MIITFKDIASANIAEGISNKITRQALPYELHKLAQIKLALLNRAKSLSDLFAPGLKLEKLKGNRKGQYSIRINAKYRICFEWKSEGVYNVEVIDYH